MQAAAERGTGETARAALWLGFFASVLIAWALVWRMVAGAAGGWLCGPADVAVLPFGGVPALAAMWAAMTAAMMLPTFVPALSRFLALPGQATGGAVGAALLTIGYLAVWVAVSVVFALAQAGLIRASALDTSGALTSTFAAAALLLVAGLWQFSRPKAACQTACLRPETRYLLRLSPGPLGALRMGAELGAACVGCCWALMALAFVGGAMSLLWMGLATLFMVLEKLPDLGHHLRRPAGALMIAAAPFVAAGGLT